MQQSLVPSSTRRLVALLLVGLLLIAGCSSDDDDAGDDSTADDSTPASDEGAFPVEIEHRFGTTEITEAPERVVSVGLVEQDALLALGVTPVGVTDWFGDQPSAVWPWSQDLLGDAEPEVLTEADTANPEAIAALEPDLIIGVYSGITEEQYEVLSQIAPTVAQPEEYVDYGVPWQVLTRTVGQAVGQEEHADELIAEVEGQIADAAAEHPEFDGASAMMAMPYEGIYVYGPEDPRSRFLTDLGFTLPEELGEIAGEEFGGQLSEERADLLDVDAIVWIDAEDSTTGALGGPLYGGLDVHTEGREVLLDSEAEDGLGGATSFVTVRSIPFLLEGIVPMLSAAVDGDPATEVAAA